MYGVICLRFARSFMRMLYTGKRAAVKGTFDSR
jgi:hypothetical protein